MIDAPLACVFNSALLSPRTVTLTRPIQCSSTKSREVAVADCAVLACKVLQKVDRVGHELGRELRVVAHVDHKLC